MGFEGGACWKHHWGAAPPASVGILKRPHLVPFCLTFSDVLQVPFFCVSPFLCSKLSEALDLFCRGFAHERLFCSPHKTHLHFPCSSLDAGSPKSFPYKYILFSFCHLRFLSMTDKVERISTGCAKHTNMREQGEVTGSSSSTEIAVYFKAVWIIQDSTCFPHGDGVC